MKPLFILIAVFISVLAINRFISQEWNFILSGNIAMGAMLLFTALGHFMFTDGMAMMLPGFVPYKKTVVYLTGLIEIAAAIGLLLPSMRQPTSLWLIIFLIVILPANIYAAMKQVDYQKATYEGSGLQYLWFRVPLQFFFIAWVWLFNFYWG